MNLENKNTELSEIITDEFIVKSDGKESDSYVTKRTIDEVLDKETGEIIKSEDFFLKAESEIIQYRRRLAEAIAGYTTPKFVCAYCGQMLKLSGKQTSRGQVSFFAHLHDSDDCEIKTNGEFTKEEIEIRKYANIRESQRHIDLKKEIANALEGEHSIGIGIRNVEIEKRITSNVPYLYWKQPDIFVEFGDINIVFELQLSTTFLSAIIDRDIFYRLNKTFIVWVFNFSDNQEYINLSNLMCKDIYYTNKRNAFVFDDRARSFSKAEEQLVLLCIWFEPFIENGMFYPEKSIRKQEYIRLSDLKFDHEIYKPYYIDADSMFFKYQPELQTSRITLEQLTSNRIKKTEKRKLDREYLHNKSENKISELKELIKNGTAKLQLFSKKDKYGFECNDISVTEPIYSEAIEIVEKGYFKVKKSKKYGLIDFLGEIVLDCDYKELIFVFEDKCIVNEKNEWFCIDIHSKNKNFIHKSKDKESVIKLEVINEISFVVRIENTVGILHNSYQFHRYDSIDNFQDNGLAVAKRGGRWKEGNSTHNGKFWVYTPKEFIPGKTVYIEKTGEELISDVFEIRENYFKGTKYEKWGVETKDKTTIIPFEYSILGKFINGKAEAKKNECWGYIDEQGNTIIPFEYSYIGEFINGKAKACKSNRWGNIDEQGNTIIPFEYNEIEKFINGKAKACKNNRWGYIDEQYNTIIPFDYDVIGEFINGKAKARKNGFDGFINENGDGYVLFKEDKSYEGKYGELIENFKFGLKDTNNNVLAPAIYDKIEEFIGGKAKAYKDKMYVSGGKWSPEYTYKIGLIDEKGNELIESSTELENGLIKGKKFEKWGIQTKENKIIVPFIYNEIGEFVNGKAKALKGKIIIYVDEQGNDLNASSNISSYIVNSTHNGKIANIVDFGLFVILNNDLTALLHISELKKHNKTCANFNVGNDIEVKILNVDAKKNRISLTLSFY